MGILTLVLGLAVGHSSPRGRYFRSIFRGHRLHHCKNEHTWFGVTSILGDQVLGTAPPSRPSPAPAPRVTLRVKT